MKKAIPRVIFKTRVRDLVKYFENNKQELN